MNKATGNKWKLGIFVTCSFLLLLTGIYFIGQRQQLFTKTFHLSGIFTDISGLQVGNNVRFSGINVGIIDQIEQVTDSTVRVDMLIVETTRKFLKKNARAIIGNDGLMGNKIVVIAPGEMSSAEVLKDNDQIATTQPVSMDDILENLKITTDNAADITDDLAEVIGNIRSGRGTIGKLLMDTVFATTLDKTLVNIKQGAGGFKQNMDAASHNFLLRGYLKRKERRKQKEQQKQEEAQQDRKKK